MDNNSGAVRKMQVCRYFAASGECFYGEFCQFLHQMPNANSSRASSNTFVQDGMNKLKNTSLGNLPPPESKLSYYLGFSGGSGEMSNELTNSFNAMGLASKRKIIGSGTNMSSLQVNSPPFIPTENIKLELLKKQNLVLNFSNGETFSEIPTRVDKYHDLYPLDGAITTPSSTFGMITTIYKATNMRTGQLVCLRRLHSFNCFPDNAFPPSVQKQLNVWTEMRNANIVKLHDVLFTKEFGDNSLVFVYDYHPIAKTLASQYLLNSTNGLFNVGTGSPTLTNRPFSQQQQAIRTKLLPEPLIWSYVIQISSAIRYIHLNELVCHSLHPSKIIITSGFAPEVSQFQPQPMHQPRVKLSSCGIFDVIKHKKGVEDLSSKQLLLARQQEDLIEFGKLCIMLSCNSISAVKSDNWNQSLEIITRNYSNDLRQLIVYLVSANGTLSDGASATNSTFISINEIMPMIGARFYTELNQSYQRSDEIETEMNKELDNSRLFRLLAKLGTINERPEHKMDSNWSETGDRYMLKLFRDYLFHQTTEDGRPWIDLGHIVCTLNKLDVGSNEKICLMSRDQQNVLIVSFAELKKCFDASFNELLL